MTLTNEQMKNSLNRVIAVIDRWWVEVTNLKKGAFYRYDLSGSSNLTFKDYIEWRYKSGAFEKDYISLFISFVVPRKDTVSIELNLRKMENGVYTEYDPFCQFQNNNYSVSVDAETGFSKNSMIWNFITINDINHLMDRIPSIMENIQVDQPVEETGSNDEITDEEEIMNTRNESVTTGDGLEELEMNELLNVVITELNDLRGYRPKFFNASIGSDPYKHGGGVVFNIEYTVGRFSIKITNNEYYVCQLEYAWSVRDNAYILDITMLNKNGDRLDHYKGICIHPDNPKLTFWNQSELETSGYEYLWEFMSSIYNAIYEAMRKEWIKQHEIEEDLEHTQYNGIISRPIFDPQFLEPGALLQIYVKEDLDDGLFKKGYHYNCFVMEQIDHNTGLKVMCLNHNVEVTEHVFSVKDVTTGKIEINRVK